MLPTAELAGKSWADYRRGDRLRQTIDEMVREADRIASEHVQVMTRDPDYFLAQHDQLWCAVSRLHAPTSRSATR